jgi:hypothetical protein
LFIFLAIALLGLICIGLVGLAGAVYLFQSNFAEQAALPTATPFIPVPTVTNTPTPTSTPTETPLPTPTATLVVSGEEMPAPENQTPGEESTPAPTEEPTATPTTGLGLPTAPPEVEATPTSTAVVASPTSETEPGTETTPAATTAPSLPGSGGVLPANGNFLIWIGSALLGLLLFGVWKQFRAP